MLILRSMHPLFLQTAPSLMEIHDDQFRCNRYVLTCEIPEGLLLWNTLSLGLVFLKNTTVSAWSKKNCHKRKMIF